MLENNLGRKSVGSIVLLNNESSVIKVGNWVCRCSSICYPGSSKVIQGYGAVPKEVLKNALRLNALICTSAPIRDCRTC